MVDQLGRDPSPTTETSRSLKPILPDYSPPGIQWTQGGRPSSRGSAGTGYDLPTARQASGLSTYEAPEVPSQTLTRDQAADIGKTRVSISPDVPNPLIPEDLQAPDRIPGFFEGMLGGLVDAFTGALPGWFRDPAVGLAQGIGRVGDIPGEALGHIPINQMLGLEDLKGAFQMVEMTDEKRG